MRLFFPKNTITTPLWSDALKCLQEKKKDKLFQLQCLSVHCALRLFEVYRAAAQNCCRKWGQSPPRLACSPSSCSVSLAEPRGLFLHQEVEGVDQYNTCHMITQQKKKKSLFKNKLYLPACSCPSLLGSDHIGDFTRV